MMLLKLLGLSSIISLALSQTTTTTTLAPTTTTTITLRPSTTTTTLAPTTTTTTTLAPTTTTTTTVRPTTLSTTTTTTLAPTTTTTTTLVPTTTTTVRPTTPSTTTTTSTTTLAPTTTTTTTVRPTTPSSTTTTTTVPTTTTTLRPSTLTSTTLATTTVRTDVPATASQLWNVNYYYNYIFGVHAFCADFDCLNEIQDNGIGYDMRSGKGRLGRAVAESQIASVRASCPNGSSSLRNLAFTKSGNKYLHNLDGNGLKQGWVSIVNGACGAKVPIKRWKSKVTDDMMYAGDLEWNTWYQGMVQDGGAVQFYMWE